MIDLEPIRTRWIAERPLYEALCQHVKCVLQQDLRRRGLSVLVEARAKDVASLLKKVLKKSYDNPYDDVRDKAGVRVIVAFLGDAEAVESAIRERFDVRGYENKTLGLPYDRLGYLGLHFDVALTTPDLTSPAWLDRLCEIQVHTTAQHCWSDVSHRLLYKAAQDAPTEVKRSIHRLMALIEVFDETVTAARKTIEAMPGAPEAQLLAGLEQLFFQLVARDYDRELSLEIIATLRPLYDVGELPSLKDRVGAFVSENRAKLEGIFDSYRHDDRNFLLFQPEALLIFERLNSDAFRLKEAWSRTFPLPLLERLAAIWGRPL